MAETWKITAQRQTSVLASGTFQDGMAVDFETTDGTTGTVKLPLTQYTAENVQQAIDDRVAAIEAVKGL